MRQTVSIAAKILGPVLAACIPFLAQAEEPDGKPGDVCLMCHQLEEEAIEHTRHGVRGDAGTPWGSGAACQSCHGESAEHAKSFFEHKPTIVFSNKTPAEERSAPCLTCHQDDKRAHWAGGAHSRNDIACNDCHKSHQPVDQVMVASAQAGVCFDCHKEKRAASLKASTHPVRSGWMPCTSCHQPHGSVGEAELAKSTVNENCYSCHADKRGPFLWEHPPSSENCANCHEPHGTNNAPLLVTRAPFLCTQCHLTPFHGSRLDNGSNLPPGTGGSQMLGASCMNCHVKIHGSNHPSGARFTR